MIVGAGRHRRLEYAVYVAAGMLGGWIWFGASGAALLGLWALLRRPPRRVVLTIPALPRNVRFGSRVIVWGTGPGGFKDRQCLYSDELPPADFARFRRELIASANEDRRMR